MVYVGVDLHRKRSHVVALDPAGEVVLSRRIGNAPVEFWRIFGELEPEPVVVVFEATYGWSWFADLLADAGIAAHMAHPLATKAIAAARVKNDAVDAKTLAHLLRTNLLAEAWIAPPAAVRPAGWSAPGLGWSGCAHGCNPSGMRCWPTWASSPS
jgi:transposase